MYIVHFSTSRCELSKKWTSIRQNTEDRMSLRWMHPLPGSPKSIWGWMHEWRFVTLVSSLIHSIHRPFNAEMAFCSTCSITDTTQYTALPMHAPRLPNSCWCRFRVFANFSQDLRKWRKHSPLFCTHSALFRFPLQSLGFHLPEEEEYTHTLC